MARPKKLLGNIKELECAQCGTKFQHGIRAIFTIKPAEVTIDFFIVYDSDIEDYDVFFCSNACFIKYLTEVLKNVRGISREEETGRGSPN